MAKASATLGSIPLLFDPDEVTWDFRIKAAVQSTIGGRVIQVFGTDLGDMTVMGQFGNGDISANDTASWEAAERFMTEVTEMVKAVADDNDATPIRFRVPSMGWGFLVYVKDIAPVRHSVTSIAMTYVLTLFIVEDITQTITRDIQDKYIERLMKGIGWEQSDYNGPTADQLEETLAPYGGSVTGYMQAQLVNIMSESGMGGTSVGQAGGPVAGPEGINAYLWALREQESGGNYKAYNALFGASGAYQYIRSTWNNYKGYAEARDAPPEVQDERVAIDANAAYDKYGSWEAHASIHYSGEWWPPGSPVRDKPQPGGPTIGAYINSVMAKMGQYPGPGN